MFQRVLSKISKALGEASITYMVIGGQAVLQYSEPRFTNDIDVTLGIGADQTTKMLALAKAQGWRILVENPEAFIQETMVLPVEDTETHIRIDFIFSWTSYEQNAIARSSIIAGSESSDIHYATKEDIIIHKMLARRARDLEDIKNILLANQTIDHAYIETCLKTFEVDLGISILPEYLALKKQIL